MFVKILLPQGSTSNPKDTGKDYCAVAEISTADVVRDESTHENVAGVSFEYAHLGS